MSFSHEVKETISSIISPTKGERKKELQAFYYLTASRERDDLIVFATENILVAKKVIILLHEFFKDKYSFRVQYRGRFRKVFYIVNLYTRDNKFFELRKIIKNKEKSAFLRSTFLARGSLTDPKKGYHLELRCPSFTAYIFLRDLLSSFEIDPKGITRKNVFFLYLKDGEMISDFLKVIGAYQYMFAFEETRVIKEMKNMANRRNNCDLANLDKTIKAASKQVRIINRIGIGNLTPGLREIASLRIEHPELSLSELGELCSPPLKKSAVNYRLKKIEKLHEVNK